MDANQKAILCLLKFADRPRAAIAVARRVLSDLCDLRDSEFRALLTALGTFAKDNESYFLRYYGQGADEAEKVALSQQLNELEAHIEQGENVHWIVFRKPNEPRMRAAYEVLAGWVLKFLYQKKNAVPIDYIDGQALVWTALNSLPDSEILWENFLEWFRSNKRIHWQTTVTTLLSVAPKRPIGAVATPSNLFDDISDFLAQAVSSNPKLLRKFQASARRQWEAAETLEQRRAALCASMSAASSIPPFSFGVTISLRTSTVSAGQNIRIRTCISCQSDNGVRTAGSRLLIPESKKVWYDEPGQNLKGGGLNPPLCPECFFAATVSGFYPSSDYAVCEVPLTSSYQTFLLAQRMSSVTAALGAMAIARAPLLTVFPARYFLVRLSTAKGSLPTKTQLYLLLADYSHCFEVPLTKVHPDERHIKAHIDQAGAVNFLSIHVDILKILSLFKRGEMLPYHYGNDKARANDCIRLLESGKPYAAFYRLIFEPYKKQGWLSDRNVFKSTNSFDTYDSTVQKCAAKLFRLFWKGGETEMLIQNPVEFYQDVKTLSDQLYNLLRPLAQDEVNESGSKVSVIVRKCTEAVEKRFPQLNLVELQYLVAKAGDDADKRRASGKTVYIARKDKLSDSLNEVEGKVLEMHRKYAEGDRGSFYLWEEFVKEVTQRLLARLLLGVTHHVNKEE